jgi:hypothetical protein
MILHILVTVFFFGIAILLCILSVIRTLYVFSAWQPPDIPGDCAANVPTGERREQSRPVYGDMHRWQQKS